MINDIKPYTSVSLAFQRNIEPRRLELAEIMGTLKRIPVYEIKKHHVVREEDWHEDGVVMMGWYCDQCLTDRDDISSNECRRRIGR
jgi:hypothetical protein